MKVKLTKEEFIKRSMNGEVFELYDCKYFYDKDESNPFRLDGVDLINNWSQFDGVNKFKVVKPKAKTKIVKEWMHKSAVGDNLWFIIDKLMTDEEAKRHFKGLKYKPTGREFEVPDE